MWECPMQSAYPNITLDMFFQPWRSRLVYTSHQTLSSPGLTLLQGVPIYYHMIMAILSFKEQDKKQTLKHLKAINVHIKPALKIFLDYLVDAKISKKYWMRYVQGIQGWAAGHIVDGEYIEYDGLSGNQLLLLHCIDAFIGLDPYLPTENTLRYIPRLQRELSQSFSAHNFRLQAEQANDSSIIGEMDAIAKQLRVRYPFFHLPIVEKKKLMLT